MSCCYRNHGGLLALIEYELSLPPVTPESFAGYVKNLKYIDTPTKYIGDAYHTVLYWHFENKDWGVWGGKTNITLSKKDRNLVYDGISTTYTFGRMVDVILGVKAVSHDKKPSYVEFSTNIPGNEAIRFELSEKNNWSLPEEFAIFLVSCAYCTLTMNYDSYPESIEVMVGLLDKRHHKIFEKGLKTAFPCGFQAIYDKGMVMFLSKKTNILGIYP